MFEVVASQHSCWALILVDDLKCFWKQTNKQGKLCAHSELHDLGCSQVENTLGRFGGFGWNSDPCPPHFLLQLWSYTSCSSTIFITPILELKFITPLLPQFLYFFLFFHKSVRGSAVATVDSPVIICGGFSQATKIKLTEALGLL